MRSIKPTILIVDDTRLNIKIMTDILEKSYNLFQATSGPQALEIVASEKIDLILLDVVMPGMDGYEVCKRLKSDHHTESIPIIFISAMTNVEDETRGLEMGAIDYIFKPFSPPILKARVRNHIELKTCRDIFEKRSLMDGLTGIANRHYFDQVFKQEWRRALRNGHSLSIIFLDIDFFKKYNDHYGHIAGDECLRKVGTALKNSVQRAGDLSARYGGEEFIIILPTASGIDAYKVGEKVRRNIEALKVAHEMSEVSEYVTVSVGVVTVIPADDMVPDSLIAKADDALYKAKKKGRNQVVAADM